MLVREEIDDITKATIESVRKGSPHDHRREDDTVLVWWLAGEAARAQKWERTHMEGEAKAKVELAKCRMALAEMKYRTEKTEYESIMRIYGAYEGEA